MAPRPFDLILASSSPYRRELLGRLGLKFRVLTPNIDESPLPSETPTQLAARLALTKARKIAELEPKSIVIGSDQVAVFDDEVLGKPGEFSRAREQLMRFSGREVEFLTAVCVISPARSYEYQTICSTVVKFRMLNADVVEAYLRAEQPYDCAGSFKVEGQGIALFESVRSDDPTALIGLPLIAVVSALQELGFVIPGSTTSSVADY